MIDRRSLFLGLGSVICAPAIVRASSLMPIKSVPASLALTEDVIKRVLADTYSNYAGVKWQVAYIGAPKFIYFPLMRAA